VPSGRGHGADEGCVREVRAGKAVNSQTQERQRDFLIPGRVARHYSQMQSRPRSTVATNRLPVRIFAAAISTAVAACGGGDTSPAVSGTGGLDASGAGGESGRGAGTGADAGQAESRGGNPGAGGTDGGVSSLPDAPTEASYDVSAEGSGSLDASTDASSLGDVITQTPDGGAYDRTGWTATSVPPYPTGQKAQNNDLKYSNAFDGNYQTRWSIGDTTSPAQMVGDQFTFDMGGLHSFRKILFWSGGLNGVNGPDPRDYPGALDATVSADCTNFDPTPVGSGTEPQPGCGGGTPCNMPFVITLAQPAIARCVRLTLTKRLQLGGGIWWAMTELFVYP